MMKLWYWDPSASLECNSMSKAIVNSPVATLLNDEVDAYEKISATVDQSAYQREDGTSDLNRFWSDHKKVLPIHYHVYLGDCGS